MRKTPEQQEALELAEQHREQALGRKATGADKKQIRQEQKNADRLVTLLGGSPKLRETKIPRQTPGFRAVALICFVALPKAMERRLDRGQRPYDLESTGWKRFARKLEKLGADNLDRGLYGGITFNADDEETGQKIAKEARTLLCKPL